MNTKPIIALLLAASALVTAPAFASGYGPAPGYRGTVGAPASQRGPSAQTLAAERDATAGSPGAYGGAIQGRSEAGSRATSVMSDSLYAHH